MSYDTIDYIYGLRVSLRSKTVRNIVSGYARLLSQLLLKHAYLAQTDYLVIPSPVLLAVTVVVALIASMAESLSLSHFEYFTVTGYFLQDDPATDPEDFDYVCSLSTLEQNAERRGPSTNQNVVIKRIRPHKPKVRYR